MTKEQNTTSNPISLEAIYEFMQITAIENRKNNGDFKKGIVIYTRLIEDHLHKICKRKDDEQKEIFKF